MMVQVLGAFCAVISFAVILEIPKKFVIYAGLVGAVGSVVYLYVDHRASIIVGAFVSSLVVAFISHMFARIFKAPVTVFLVAGILPSVPGTSIYRSVYYLIHDGSDLASFYREETLLIAGSIAMAIFIMDSLFRLTQRK